MGIPPLTNTNFTMLVSMFTHSAAIFEQSELILTNSEDTKLQILSSAAASGFISTTAVSNAKIDINGTISGMSSLVNEIKKKAAAGTHLKNSWS